MVEEALEESAPDEVFFAEDGKVDDSSCCSDEISPSSPDVAESEQPKNTSVVKSIAYDESLSMIKASFKEIWDVI